MERGLTFLEFNYMIMQVTISICYTRNTVVIFSLMEMTSGLCVCGGTELIRRKLGKDASAMTISHFFLIQRVRRWVRQ